MQEQRESGAQSRNARALAAGAMVALALFGPGCARPLCDDVAARCIPADGGTGDEPGDGGTGDGGTAPGDGGVGDGGVGDGGGRVASCPELPHDPVLGTAQLAPGFRVAGSVALELNWPTGMVPGVGGPSVQAIVSGNVHVLGRWPTLEGPTDANRLFDAVAPVDRQWSLHTASGPEAAGSRLMVGYATNGEGRVRSERLALFDTGRPGDGVTHLDAPGYESLGALGSYFLVGSRGVGTLQGTRGVYALSTQPPAYQVALAATYPQEPTVRPGPIATTTHGLAVLGYYLDDVGTHSLRVVPPARLMEATSGGAPVVLSELPELTARGDVQGAVGMGTGVVVLHSRLAGGQLYGLGTLRYYPLTVQGGEVSVGAAQDVLGSTAHDDFGACTAVNRLDTVGDDLVVTLADRKHGGVRLVRITRQ